MRIYVNGLHSGTNPQPRIGITRSLRLAYPDATLVGVEYSNRSSGIQWSDFDEVWLQRPWRELSFAHYAVQIRDLLNEGALWLCGRDLEILLEPGKALAQPAMALAVRVLELHRSNDKIDGAVVDGSIAELAVQYLHPHRILHRDTRDGEWRPLPGGSARLLGRLCMEDEIVATSIDRPAEVGAGDVLVICDAGGYDRSMSYVFGQG